jgi:hypothetical protein
MQPPVYGLVRALVVETHENWIEAMQYLNMNPPRASRKKRHATREMRRDAFYRADQGNALSCRRPFPGPHPGSLGRLTHIQFAKLDTHNSTA